MIYKSDRLLYLKCSDMEDIINLYVDVYLQTNPVKIQQKLSASEGGAKVQDSPTRGFQRMIEAGVITLRLTDW